MNNRILFLVVAICLHLGCSDLQRSVNGDSVTLTEYLDFSNRDDQFTGGILAMEYALKYQENLKGLIISNMMSSCPA